MPVKIRCKGCGQKLNVPDKARGKAIKCPSCSEVIKVPAGDAEPVEKKAAAPRKKEKAVATERADSTAFLMKLDLDKLQDSKVKLCPKCGAEVDPETIECPECGVNVETGVMSAETRKRRTRKGPDPNTFYKTSWKDGWQFIAKNKPIVMRSTIYCSLFSFLSLSCSFMALWCRTAPPQAFWIFCAFVSGLIPFGWVWFLDTEIIRVTMGGKDKIKKLHVDFFKNVALGINLLGWVVAVSLPIQVITVPLLIASVSLLGQPIVGYVIVALGFLFTLMLFPIAMVHMTMPVMTRGWLIHVLVSVFPSVWKAAAYWSLLFLLTLSPAIAGATVIGTVYANKLDAFYGRMVERNEIATAKAWVRTKEQPEMPDGYDQLKRKTPPAYNFLDLAVPGVLFLFSTMAFGSLVVFNMRTNGMFGRYFRDDLRLVTLAKEVKYVAKGSLREQVKEETSVGTVLVFAVFSLIFAIVQAVRTGETMYWVAWGFIAMVMWIPVAGMWRIFEKAGRRGYDSIVPIKREISLAHVADKPVWWGLLMVIPGLNVILWIPTALVIANKFKKSSGFGLGLALLPPIFIPMLGFSDAKYGDAGPQEWTPPSIDD